VYGGSWISGEELKWQNVKLKMDEILRYAQNDSVCSARGDSSLRSE